MTTDHAQVRLERIRETAHPNCVVCGRSNYHGLGVNFELLGDGSVQAEFDCDIAFEGYPDYVHGGIISSLLDGAMVNCLFAHGHTAVTAELTIRYRHPVVSNRPASVRAWIVQSTSPLYLLASEITQDGQLKVTCRGKFMDKPQLTNGK